MSRDARACCRWLLSTAPPSRRSRASAPLERLAPIQQAFVHHYGMQCGFCTPGILLAAHAHIERGGGDDQTSISESLAGHVCRCTGYVKIVNAVGAAVRGESFDLTETTGTPTTTTLVTGGAE